MTRTVFFKRIRAVKIIALPLVLAACQSVNPATGQRQFTPFMSAAQEARIGAQEHPKILKQLGGVYDDPELGAYVASISGRLVANSELAGSPVTVTVLDSPVVNAFALPGGYIYVTRGLLALANSEAELAGVLAHEIGHVTARHTAERYSRATVANIGSMLLGSVVGSSELQKLATLGSQAYLAGFSREQEYQADLLGVRYLGRTGYDPFAEADFLAAMGNYSALEARLAGQDGRAGGSFLSTHPGTAKRVRAAIAAAGGTGSQPHARPRHRDRYLAHIDGMVYGDDPDHGLVQGRVFSHPRLGFTFTVPRGFQIFNTDDAVIGKGPGDSYVVFDGARAGPHLGMQNYLTGEWAPKVKLEAVEPLTINGMEAATGRTRTTGQRGAFDIRYVAVRFGGDQIYRFQFVTPPSQTGALATGLQRTTFSFRRLGTEEITKLKPLRIKVMEAGPGDSLESLAGPMPFDELKTERLATLNGMVVGQPLRAGQRIKVITNR
ncbi:MAG: M48 family metalloprotease [Sphingomonadales bacterium]